MNFKRRLKFFLIGVGLGTILVYFFFRDRELGSWLPDNRVKDKIAMNRVLYTEKAKCQFDCMELTKSWLLSFLGNADVDFGSSETRKEPCPQYKLNGKIAGIESSVWLTVCDTTSTIMVIDRKNMNCDCD